MLETVTSLIRRVPPAAPLLVGVAVLLLVAVLSATGESAVEVGQGWVPGFGREASAPASENANPSDWEYQTPPALRAAAVVGMLVLMLTVTLLFLLGLAAILFSMRFERRRRSRKLAPISPADEPDGGATVNVDLMRRAAGGALDRLLERAGGEPGDAVVLAWLTLEEAAAESGLARRPHQTPTEFTTAVLAELAVDAAALRRLRGLYQRARFSTHPVTGDDARAAEDALRRLVADLEAATAATAAAPTAPASVTPTATADPR